MLAVLLAALESDEDRALFTEVYEQYHIRMEKDSMYILNDRSDAEDAVQNAFMQVIRHFDIFFEVPCKKRVFWCISIVKNEALTILRQRKKMVLSDELEGDPVVDVEEALNYQEVVRLFSGLPDTYRSVLEMCLLFGFSGKEIAERMGLTENTVNVRIARGRAILRKIAEKEGFCP